MSRRTSVISVAFVLTMVSATVAAAQVIERPPRVYRGLFGAGVSDPNRWTHSVTLMGNAFAGLDDNLTPAAGDTGNVSGNTPGTRGYTGFGGAQLQYSSTKAAQAVEFAVRGFSNGFHGIGLEPVFGGEASGRVSTSLGRRSTLSVYERYSDSPLFAPQQTAARSPLDGPFAPASTPLANTTSYLIRRSKAQDGNLVLQRRMTRRTTMSIGGIHGQTRFDDGAGDSETWGGMLTYGRTVGRSSTVSTAYNYVSSTSAAVRDLPARPRESHNLTFSIASSRRLTPSRRLAMSIGAGVTEQHTLSSQTNAPLSYRTPSGQASVRLDFARSWNVGADYGRTVSVIEGVTLDSFVTDNVSVRAGGDLWGIGDLAVSGSRAAGQAGPTGSGHYASYSSIVQLRFNVNRWIDSLISYTFYAYRLDGVTTIVEGLPTRLDRHAVRAGLTFRLPLFGEYIGPEDTRGPR